MDFFLRAGRDTGSALGVRRILTLTVLIPLFTAAPAVGAPPEVVSTTPATADTSVDPATREIRVKFDQPMNRGGFSFVGGGENYPKTTGKPRWASATVCVLPVKLEPNHDYQLSINSTTFQNFKNVSGEPAVPYALTFKTGAAKGKAKPGAGAKNIDYRAAATELRRAIEKEYSHHDLHHVNWAAAFKTHEAALLAAKTPQAFAEEAALLLAPARDVHMTLLVDHKPIATYKRQIAPNFDLNQVRKTVSDFVRVSPLVYTGSLDKTTKYLLIGAWSKNRNQEVRAALKALADNRSAPAMIIDVRPNSGGDEMLAREFAGCFITEPRVYARHAVRSGGTFSAPQARTLTPNAKGPAYRGRVAVLMGPMNMSSCESFLLMMKQVPGCVLVGQKSYGSSGNPQPVDLGNGVTLMCPSWKVLLPDGTELEGRGVTPDVEVKAAASKTDLPDPAIAAALAEVQKSR